MSYSVINFTERPIRYSFTRRNDLAYVSGLLPAGTFPENDDTDWFDLLPGHSCPRVGGFGGVNWEPIQTPTR